MFWFQDEIQAKTSLANKMESETEDFEKYQGDSSRKLARVSYVSRKYSNIILSEPGWK